MKRRHAFAKEEKLQMIVAAFLTAYNAGQDDMIVSEIARAVGNVPSTKFRALLGALLAQGVIEREDEPMPGSITGVRHVYKLTPEYLSYAALPRSRADKHTHAIRINVRGNSSIEVLR